MHASARLALPLTALLAAAACGPTSEEQVMGALAARCAEQLGATYQAAQDALRGGYRMGPLCSASLAPLPDGDSCGAATAEAEICQVFTEWFSADSGVCPGGACTCELRLRRADLDANAGDAIVCAARFIRGPFDAEAAARPLRSGRTEAR